MASHSIATSSRLWRGLTRQGLSQVAVPAIAPRYMHTPGRQIPNPPTPTTSAHNSIPPSLDQHSLTTPGDHLPNEIDIADRSGSVPTSALAATTARLEAQAEILTYRAGATRFTAKGKPIATRPPTRASTPASEDEKLKRDHALYKFFRIDPMLTQPLGGMGLTAEELAVDRYEEGEGEGMLSVEPIFGDETNLSSGRSWTAKELREKSFADLHTLWYILLRERNVLATQREERRRLGIQMDRELLTKRAFRCRKSMARIKYVLNERRLALVAAAESSRPTSHPAIRVHARSPLGTADPLSLTGFEEIEYTAEEKALLADELNGDEEGLSGGFGDGERQKMDLNVGKEGKAVAEKAEVSQAEVESRDEGFGGGSEAKEFVKTMNERQA
ncbi:hypothetical protein QFC24_002325 [Naganishia onofrii]|uniref:Uncharacterized protein n=1 Tax=Naganishia onofrii TaxID=1851511 RepID=A0ACC2XPW2_9TREE|nr:hypothetical protein QFC24_002325 [Naganishia onofrii]